MKLPFGLFSKKVGIAPGELIHVGERKVENTRIRAMDYSPDHLDEKLLDQVDDCFPFKETETVSWVNIDGLHETDVYEKLGKYYDIHPLVLADVLNTTQRAKYEEYDHQIFAVVKMFSYKEEAKEVQSEQVSFIIGKNHLFTFQERYGDVFEGVRERIRKGKGRVRKMGPAYLAYLLMDVIVDNYFVVLEKIGERIEALEEHIASNPSTSALRELHHLKRTIISIRRAVWPLREVAQSFRNADSDLLDDATKPFFRDLYDHTIQAMDVVDTYREMLSSIADFYQSSLSNRMNQVMKVLTVFASTFIPLTFVAGIYGMNFEYMPELKWKYGYFVTLGGFAAIGIGLLLFFKRKRWL